MSDKKTKDKPLVPFMLSARIEAQPLAKWRRVICVRQTDKEGRREKEREGIRVASSKIERDKRHRWETSDLGRVKSLLTRRTNLMTIGPFRQKPDRQRSLGLDYVPQRMISRPAVIHSKESFAWRGRANEEGTSADEMKQVELVPEGGRKK